MKQYKLIFLREFNNTLNIVKITELNYLSNIFRLDNKHTFKIDINNVCFINKEQKTYFIDIDSGNQYTFKTIQAKMEPNQLDVIVSTKILKELASGIVENNKEKIILIIIGFIIGIILGLLIMQIISSGKIEELLKTIDNSPVIPFQLLLNGG